MSQAQAQGEAQALGPGVVERKQSCKETRQNIATLVAPVSVSYNDFNHTQYAHIDTTARFDLTTGAQVNAQFGSVNATRDARRIVMG